MGKVNGNICFLKTSFQKSKIGGPQLPQTEKILKFNMIIHDFTKKHFFSKHQNKAEFCTLDNSELFSGDFPCLGKIFLVL